jgi:hypothetical protein
MTKELMPETSSELLWMIFSLLALEPSKQVEILGDLPHTGTADKQALENNGAASLVYLLQDHYVSWLDEFEPCPAAQQLFDLAWSMYGEQTYEDFMNGTDWQQLRDLARMALTESGLDPWPLPQSVDLFAFRENKGPK